MASDVEHKGNGRRGGEEEEIGASQGGFASIFRAMHEEWLLRNASDEVETSRVLSILANGIYYQQTRTKEAKV